MLNQPLDLERLHSEFVSAKPFPYLKIDNFLNEDFARSVSGAYPSFDTALVQGRSFSAVNERKKVQITDSSKFLGPVAKLNEFLASRQFLSDLAQITGISRLLADQQLVGGGMHITGPGGHLDVHIDFNYIEDRALHRRLNLLLYLNPEWDPAYGGQLQLWNTDVSECVATFDPEFNRCVIFETSDISFHGVVPVSSSAKFPRKSFATYYYTEEAPAGWDGKSHSTIFKARPDEKLKGYLFMPAARARTATKLGIDRLKGGLKRVLRR
jgi:hypothetical protein